MSHRENNRAQHAQNDPGSSCRAHAGVPARKNAQADHPGDVAQHLRAGKKREYEEVPMPEDLPLQEKSK